MRQRPQWLAGGAQARLGHHRAHWPTEQIHYQGLIGGLLGRLLRGEPVLELVFDAEQRAARMSVSGLDDHERRLLDERLPPPPPPDRRRPAAKGFARWVIELPRAARVSAKWARAEIAEGQNYVELSDGSVMAIVFVIDPIMSELGQVFRLRSGDGPKSLKGRADALERSLAAHRLLGLDPTPVEPLLEPHLTAQAVVERRTALLASWAQAPDDIGERALALLCAQLAERYYAKANKAGQARQAQVLTAATEALLSVTLADWDGLLGYLDEGAAPADANPVSVDQITVPQTAPAQVADRVSFCRRWWTEVFDAAHAAQRPGDPTLWGLVPEPYAVDEPAGADCGEGEGPRGRESVSWCDRMSAQMREELQQLWGTTVLERYPDVLIEAPHPETVFAGVLGPAVRFWEGAALTAWYVCFGPYSRTSIPGLAEYHQGQLDDLDDLGTPIDPALFAELTDAARDEGLEGVGPAIGLTIEVTLTPSGDWEYEESTEQDDSQDSPRAFERLNAIITAYRRRWIDGHLDSYLDRLWRSSLSQAAQGYGELYVGRGKAPTLKQAIGVVRPAAVGWFGGDTSALAAALGLDGPIASPMRTSSRPLPADLGRVCARVSDLLGGVSLRDARDWTTRRRWELAQHSPAVLALWQASGELPARPAAMKGRDYLLREAFETEPDAAYEEYLAALRIALGEVGHPAAEAPLATSRRGRPPKS